MATKKKSLEEKIIHSLDGIEQSLTQITHDDKSAGSLLEAIWHNQLAIIKKLSTENELNDDNVQLPSTEGHHAVRHASTQPGSSDLYFYDLADVLEVLENSGFTVADWQSLGLRLGLYLSTLETIESDCKKKSLNCLMKTLDKWLRRVDIVNKKGRPSWDTLAVALRKIDENASATYISEQKINLEIERSDIDNVVRDEAIVNVVKNTGQSLIEQSNKKIEGLLEKMELATSQSREKINQQLIEEIQQLKDINERLNDSLSELNEIKSKLQETTIDKQKLERFKVLYENSLDVEHQLNKEKEDLMKQRQKLDYAHKMAKSELNQLRSLNRDIKCQLDDKTKCINQLTEEHKLELHQLKCSKEDITHQLEAKIKQVEKLTEVHKKDIDCLNKEHEKQIESLKLSRDEDVRLLHKERNEISEQLQSENKKLLVSNDKLLLEIQDLKKQIEFKGTSTQIVFFMMLLVYCCILKHHSIYNLLVF
jgi:myosin heavy subunit